MTSDRHYVEVPRDRVPDGMASNAESIAAFAARDLGIRPPRVRWLAQGTPREAAAARRRGLFTSTRRSGVYGLYAARERGCIFVDIGAPATTVAHEVRHYWQHLGGIPLFDKQHDQTVERDARAYADRITTEWRRHRAEAA